jgi:bifunctional non-homologous end joining protein LigD
MNSTLKISNKNLTLTNLEKVLYPKAGFTKGEVIQYYIEIAPALLPHLKNRPLTLKRYPNGVDKEFFYEKRCPPYRPKWLKTAPVWSERKGVEIHYCMANNLESLIWAVNLADLELHTSLSRYPVLNQPTMMVFDLDPGEGADIVNCCEVGLWIQKFFERQKLKCYPKTTGSKGLQIYLPLNTKVSYEETKTYSHLLAQELTQLHPDKVLFKMDKSLRKGKVFIDWSQNDDYKTTVCVYSLRAKDYPGVSTPVSWDEVEKVLKSKDPKPFVFSPSDVVNRFKKQGDLFEDILLKKQKMPKSSNLKSFLS